MSGQRTLSNRSTWYKWVVMVRMSAYKFAAESHARISAWFIWIVAIATRKRITVPKTKRRSQTRLYVLSDQHLVRLLAIARLTAMSTEAGTSASIII